MFPITELGLVHLTAIAVLQFLLGGATTASIYWLRERGLAAGLLGSAALVPSIVLAQYWFGITYFTLSRIDSIQVVVASALAGITGLALAAIALEPELNHHQKRNLRRREPPQRPPDESNTSNRSLADFVDDDGHSSIAEAIEKGESNG